MLRKQQILTTYFSEKSEVRLGGSVDFLPGAILRPLERGESSDCGLAVSSVSSSAFESVLCCSIAARAALSLLTHDCRDWATGTDFSEDTGDDGLDEADESGDLGSWVDFLLDGCAEFGAFFDCQQVHINQLAHVYLLSAHWLFKFVPTTSTLTYESLIHHVRKKHIFGIMCAKN